MAADLPVNGYTFFLMTPNCSLKVVVVAEWETISMVNTDELIDVS